MRGLPDSLAVLRQRDYRLLFCGQAVSVFGDRMVAVALAFAVLEVGGSTSAVGLVLACATLPLVGSVLVGGVVADRTSRRAVMVGADLVRLASQGTTSALLIAGAAQVWTLALLAGVTGAATGFFNPASTGLLPAVVASEQLQQANGLRATAVSTGEILGPLAAGVLVAAAGAGWAIAIDAATFAISAAFLMRLRLPAHVAPRPAHFSATCAKAGGHSGRVAGYGRSSATSPSQTCCGRRGAHSVQWETTLQRHIPHEALSRVSSYDWFGSLVFYPLGLAIWGPVAAAIGIDVSLWLAFALMAIAVLVLLAVPDIRRLPAQPGAVAGGSGRIGRPSRP